MRYYPWKIIVTFWVIMIAVWCEAGSCQQLELEPWPEVPVDTHNPPRWYTVSDDYQLLCVGRWESIAENDPAREFWSRRNATLGSIRGGILLWWNRKPDGTILGLDTLPFPRTIFGLGESGGDGIEHLYNQFEDVRYTSWHESSTLRDSDGKITLTWEPIPPSDWPMRYSISYSLGLQGRGIDIIQTAEAVEETYSPFYIFRASYMGGMTNRWHCFGPNTEEVFGTNEQFQKTHTNGGVIPWINSPAPRFIQGVNNSNLVQSYNLFRTQKPMWFTRAEEDSKDPWNSPYLVVWSFENQNVLTALFDWEVINGDWSGRNYASDNIQEYFEMLPGKVHTRRSHIEMVKTTMPLDQTSDWQTADQIDQDWKNQLADLPDPYPPVIRFQPINQNSSQEVSSWTVRQDFDDDLFDAIEWVMDDEVNGGHSALYSKRLLHPEGGSITFNPQGFSDELGQHLVTVTATDLAGNSRSRQIMVTVVVPQDTEAPIVTLNGQAKVEWKFLPPWTDPGVLVTDNNDNNPAPVAKRTEKCPNWKPWMPTVFNPLRSGTHRFEYRATDRAGNTGLAVRDVNVSIKERNRYFWWLVTSQLQKRP